MSKLTQKIVSVSVSVATAVSLSGFAAFVPSAHAASLTSSQVSAIISLLQSFGADAATIANVQASLTGSAPVSTGGTSGSTGSSYAFTRNLTVGSTGDDVKALQQILINAGFLKISAATNYFGSMTQSALAAWQKANNISPAAGYFGALTRQAMSSVSGTPSSPVQTGAPMTISLATDSPMAQSIASGAVNMPVAKINFTAGSQPVTITALTLTRAGLSQDSDLNNVYLYDGAYKVASNLGFNNGKVNFANSVGLFTVPANTTKTITVTVDVYSAATAGRIFTFGIASASDVVGGTFSGSFPIYGAQFTVASVSNLAQLQISGYSSSSVTVNAGQSNYLVGQFTLQASNNPAKLTYLSFQNVGSVSSGDLRNIKLMYGSTQLGNTIGVLDSSNKAIFDLSNAPLMLTSGQSVVVSLYADIMGGVNRTFQFSIQQSSDIHGVDTMYGVGIGASLPSGSWPVTFYNGAISNGGLVISKSSSTPATYAVAGNTNQVLAKFDVLASGDSVRFNQINFSVSGGNTISNFRVVDDQGVQLGTTQTVSTSTYSAGSGNLNYIIPANTTRTITVYGDLDSAASGTLAITFGTSGSSAQSYTTLSSVAVSQTSANSLQVLSSSANLVAALNYSLGAPVNASAGSQSLKVASFALTAGQVNAINLTGVTLQVVNNSTVAGYLRNLQVKIGTTQIGNLQSTLTANQVYTFNASAPVAIAANATVNVDVYADIASGISATSSQAISLSAVNASTAAGNSVAISGAVTGQNVAFNTGGSLSGAIAAGTPSASYLGMGVTGVTVGQYQFTASADGSATLTQLTIRDSASTATSTTAATDASTFVNYRLVDGSTPIATASISSGNLVFNLSGLTVQPSSYKTLSLVADVNSYPYASSSGAHAFAMTGFMYTNSAGSTSTSVASSNMGNLFTVYRTSLNVAQGATFTAPSISGSTGQTIAQFNFTAGSGYDAVIKAVTLSTAGSFIQASTSQVLGIYDSAAPSVLLASSTATSTNNLSFTNLNGGSNWTIPAGQTKTLVVKPISAPANLNLPTGGGSGSYQVLLQAVTWSDSVTTSIATLSPAISIPVPGQSITAAN